MSQCGPACVPSPCPAGHSVHCDLTMCTHEERSEVAVGGCWVGGAPMSTADEPELVEIIYGQLGGVGLCACWRIEANGEAFEGGTSFLSVPLPSSWSQVSISLYRPSPLTRTAFVTVSPNTPSFAVGLPGTQRHECNTEAACSEKLTRGAPIDESTPVHMSMHTAHARLRSLCRVCGCSMHAHSVQQMGPP